MKIEIVEVPRQRCACLRTRAPLAEVPGRMGQMFHELQQRASARGLTMAGPPFARYHDHDPAAVDFEVGMPIGEDASSDDGLCVCTMGGTAATALHVGPYEQLEETFAEVLAWLAARDHAPAGPMWEVYLTDPRQVPDPAEYRTQVYVPLQRGGEGELPSAKRQSGVRDGVG